MRAGITVAAVFVFFCVVFSLFSALKSSAIQDARAVSICFVAFVDEALSHMSEKDLFTSPIVHPRVSHSKRKEKNKRKRYGERFLFLGLCFAHSNDDNKNIEPITFGLIDRYGFLSPLCRSLAPRPISLRERQRDDE